MSNQSRECLLALYAHTESDDNLKHLFCGWRNPNLTSQGIIDARMMALLTLEQNLSFSTIYCSSQERSIATMMEYLKLISNGLSSTDIDNIYQIISSAALSIYDPSSRLIDRFQHSTIHFFIHRHYPEVTMSTRLMEMGYGTLAGTSKTELQQTDGDEYHRVHSNPTYRPDNGPYLSQCGENYQDVKYRLQPFLEKLNQREDGKSLLYVGHSNTIRVILACLLGQNESDAQQYWSKKKIRNILFILTKDKHLIEITSSTT